MRQSSLLLIVFGYALAAAGLFIPFWPLTLFGAIIASLSGQWFFALLLGIFLDLLYGTPIGRWHFLYVPFTLTAIAVVLLEFYSAKFLISEASEYL